MAIYLDHQTRPYLERLIKKQIEKSDKDFIAQRVMGMLEADWKRLERMGECEHEEGTYTGKKTCCKKCEAVYKEGQGISWELDLKTDRSEGLTATEQSGK
jgi:hypothetical protein